MVVIVGRGSSCKMFAQKVLYCIRSGYSGGGLCRFQLHRKSNLRFSAILCFTSRIQFGYNFNVFHA